MRESFSSSELLRLKEAFKHFKAEKDPFFAEHTSKTFVHTGVYDLALMKGRCLLIGRKGSGKTAMLLGHKNANKELYFDSNDISMDGLPFRELFNFFFMDFISSKEKLDQKKNTTDAGDFIEAEKVAYFAWKNSILTMAIVQTSVSILKHKDEILTDEDSIDVLEKTIKNTGKLIGLTLDDFLAEDKKKVILFPLLTYFFRSIQDAIESALESDSPSLAVLLATIAQKVISQLESEVDLDLLKAAETIGEILQKLDKRVIVTLDKFDDFYDDFYQDLGVSSLDERSRKGAWINNRKAFLKILLEGLILATRDIKKYKQLSWLDTLFTIPMDKFLELHIRERMDLENEHLLFAEWTPVELFEFVNKRISEALSLEEEKTNEAWYEVFPKYVTNGKTHLPEDSFLYIVRHTLWKPREIQKYVSIMIEEMINNGGKPLSSEKIRSAVVETSKDIIRTEFIEEFLREYPGVNKLLQKLEHAPIQTVMAYSHFTNLVADFELAEFDNDPDSTMQRLFQMGLIGVRHNRPSEVKGKNPTVQQGRKHLAYCFHYNSLVTNPFSDTNNVVIHPIFYDQLGVDHREQYIVNELKWEMFEAVNE